MFGYVKDGSFMVYGVAAIRTKILVFLCWFNVQVSHDMAIFQEHVDGRVKE